MSLGPPTRLALAGVIFDLGGTLIYPSTSDEDCIQHLTKWLQVEGWPPTVEAAVRQARRWVLATTAASGRQHTMQEGVRRALGQFNRPLPDTGLIDAAERAFFEPELEGYRAFPDAVRLLENLRRAGLSVGCISNATSHWLIEQIVDRMGFRPYIDPVVSSAGYCRVKPDPGIFRSVLERWNLPPECVAMVGDTLTADIAGGRNVGARTLYVTMAPNPENRNHQHITADAEAATLAEAERILLDWARGD
ncbi:MAG: HAD family hydrolase [Armatimonadota bacterium]